MKDNKSISGGYWGFFEVHHDIDSDDRPPTKPIIPGKEMKVHCQLCGRNGKSAAVLSTASGYGSLSTHVRRSHRSLLDKLTQQLAKSTTSVEKDQEEHVSASVDQSATLDGFGFVPKKAKPYGRDNPLEARFLRVLIDWLCGDLLPLNTVESPHFQALIQCLNPNIWIPSRGTLATTDIPNRAQALLKENVFSKMGAATVVHLSFDLWMNQKYESFGLYATYVDKTSPGSWRVVEACLGVFDCPDVSGEQLSIRLEKFLSTKDLAELDIKSKVFSTTSDGGKNLKRMVEALENRVGCVSLFPTVVKPLISDCYAHLVHGVAKDSARHANYELARLETVGVLPPERNVSQILAYFLNGTAALRRSHPTWACSLTCARRLA
jgi:hypothetical protein